MKRYVLFVVIVIIVGSLFLMTHQWGTRFSANRKVQQPNLSGQWVQQSRIVIGALMDDPTDVYSFPCASHQKGIQDQRYEVSRNRLRRVAVSQPTLYELQRDFEDYD